MAEFLMKDLLEKEGLSGCVLVDSAAVSDEETGRPVYPPARRKLAEHGIGCGEKRARKIEKADYGRYDLLIGMDRSNVRRMASFFGGDPEGKILRILEFAGISRDVEDPWYTGDFDAAWDDIERGCRALLDELKKRVSAQS
ncbi:MAG: low molecular weight phosphotyrosine protein phosphatase [Clostridia bacterium]|nr:low molecular weight phosphotyrosine protein phosphatase [Clostridia bacterium]